MHKSPKPATNEEFRVLRARIERKIKASPLARRVWESPAIQRLAGAQSQAYWRTLAKLDRAIGRFGGDRRRWSTRAGWALLRAGDVDAAAEAFTFAVSGLTIAGPHPWRDVAERATSLGIGSDEAGACFGLGECARHYGDFDSAVRLMRAGFGEGRVKPSWLSSLAQVEEELGDLAGAAATLERLWAQLRSKDPQPGISLARLYTECGQWARAERILADNVEGHPLHAGSYKDRAMVIELLTRWGGSFDDTLLSRINGRFTFGATPSVTRSSVMAEAVRLQPARPTWRAALAAAYAEEGNHESAISTYEALLAEAEASNEQWALGARQKWQFGLERAHHDSGAPRVEDPLFKCELSPGDDRRLRTTSVPGFFDVQPADNGLVVEGLLGQAETTQVDLFVNGSLLRSLTPSMGYLPRFTLAIKRGTVARFPDKGWFEARTREGDLLLTRGGATRLTFSIPHGDGSLNDILGRGVTLEKKGEIKLSSQAAQMRHDRDLKIYSHAREFFDEQLGRPLFLLYGTLLGCYRDGDFITGDDDFDVGYISDKTTPEAVKQEAQDIIVELVRAGFTVSFNRRGRLFRIHLDGNGGSDRHLDVQFVWFQDGFAGAHNQACLPVTRDDFLPPTEGTLRGTTVWLPHRPEVFLSANYGPAWKTPDPGFRYYPTDVDANVRRNLAKSLMTVGEYKKLAKRVDIVAAQTPHAGRLVSLGSQSLYPLDDFIT